MVNFLHLSLSLPIFLYLVSSHTHKRVLFLLLSLVSHEQYKLSCFILYVSLAINTVRFLFFFFVVYSFLIQRHFINFYQLSPLNSFFVPSPFASYFPVSLSPCLCLCLSLSLTLSLSLSLSFSLCDCFFYVVFLVLILMFYLYFVRCSPTTLYSFLYLSPPVCTFLSIDISYLNLTQFHRFSSTCSFYSFALISFIIFHTLFYILFFFITKS